MSKDYYVWQSGDAPSGPPGAVIRQGQGENANPGEYALSGPDAAGLSPTRAGTMGSKELDLGAQVGIQRNLEFSAGGRAHRISTGPYTKA